MSNSTIVGAISLELGIDEKSLINNLTGASKVAEKQLTRSFSGIGKKLGTLLGGAAVVTFTKSCLELGSNLSEVQNVVDTTFTSMAGKVNEFAKSAQTQFGLSETMAKKYMGTLGAMSSSMGFTEAQSYDMSKAVTGLAGDVASFYNLSSDEAFNKLKGIWTGETEALKEIGVLLTQTNLDQYALNNGWGKTTIAMTEQEKVMLRYRYTLSSLGKAQGDFYKTSSSWANQTRILSLQFDSLKASLGQGFINLFTPILQLLNQFIGKLQVAAQSFADFTAKLTGQSVTEDSFNNISESALSTASNITAVAEASEEAKKTLAGFDKITKIDSSASSTNNVTSGASGSSAVDTSSGGMGAATSGIDTVISKLQVLKDYMESIKDWTVSNFGENITDSLKDIKDTFKDTFSILGGVGKDLSSLTNTLGKTFKDKAPKLINTFISNATRYFTNWGKTTNTIFSDLWNKSAYPILDKFISEGVPRLIDFKEEVINLFGNIDSKVNEIFNKIWNEALSPFIGLVTQMGLDVGTILSDIWDKYGAQLFDKLTEGIDNLSTNVLNIWNSVLKPVIDMVIGGVKELWDNNLKGVIQNVMELLAILGSRIMDLWNKFLSPLINWISSTFGPIFTKIFNNNFTTVKDALSGIMTSLNGVITFLKGVFTADWDTAWSGIKEIFSGIWDTFVSVIKTPLNLIIGFVNTALEGIASAINTVIKAVNKLSFTVPKWVPEIGGEKFGFDLKTVTASKIPLLAQGGYVKPNTPQLAVIGDNRHQGEFVTPEDKLNELLNKAVAYSHGNNYSYEMLKVLKEILKLLKDLDLNIDIDGESLKDVIVRKINENTKRTGVCEIIT